MHFISPKFNINLSFLLTIFLLLCSTIIQLPWNLHFPWLAEATNIVMVESELPEWRLKTDSKGRKVPAYQISLVADQMVSVVRTDLFPKLTQKWAEQLTEGKIDHAEFERRQGLLVQTRFLTDDNKVQRLEGKNGKVYAIGFAGKHLIQHNFMKAIEKAKSENPNFKLKSSKDLAKFVSKAFKETKEQAGGNLAPHEYLATNGRSKYLIKVGEEKSSIGQKLKAKLSGSKARIEKLAGNLHVRGWEAHNMASNVDQEMAKRGTFRDEHSDDDTKWKVEIGEDELKGSLDAAFSAQSRHLTSPDPNPVSAQWHGYMFSPEAREQGGRFAKLKRKLLGSEQSSLYRRYPEGARMKHGFELGEEERLKKHTRTADELIDNLMRENLIESGEADEARERERERKSRMQQKKQQQEQMTSFDRGTPNRRPIRERKGSSSTSVARNEKPPPVPSGTKWARRVKKGLGRAISRKGRKMFG